MNAYRLAAALFALTGLAGCVTPSGTSGFGAENEVAPIAFDVSENVYAQSELKPGMKPTRASREGSLWMMIERQESRLRTAGNLIRDEAVNAYVQGIVCTLAGPYCGDIRTYVVRVPEFNATMSPNGMMMVWSGLLLRVRNESQLAAVLGHELGHYLKRHSLKRMEDMIDKTNLLVVAQIGFAFGGIPAAGDLAALGVHGSIAAFSRDHEREADSVGLKLLAQHGYDPREAAKLWDQLMREFKADKDYSRPSIFFASHPATEERSATLAGMARHAMAERPSVSLGRERYLQTMAPLRSMFIEDELRLGRYNRLAVLLAELADDGWGLGLVRYYQGELHRLRSNDGDADKALGFYRRAIEQPDVPPVAYRSLGRLLTSKGSQAEARDAFRKYLQLEPAAPDRGVIEMMIAGAS